jgi:hypothetical protein
MDENGDTGLFRPQLNKPQLFCPTAIARPLMPSSPMAVPAQHAGLNTKHQDPMKFPVLMP